ncbi:MAG: hypothetical protein ACTSYM_00445 [Candidatus Baldrarchaeia archaeon]
MKAKMLVIHTDYLGEIVSGKVEKGYFISKNIIKDVRRTPYLLVKLSRFGRPVPLYIARALSITPYNLEKKVVETLNEHGVKEKRIEFIDITKLPKEDLKEIQKSYEAFIDWKGFLKDIGVYKEGGRAVDVKKILRAVGAGLIGFVVLMIVLSILGVVK